MISRKGTFFTLVVFLFAWLSGIAVAQERKALQRMRVGIPSWSGSFLSLIAAKKYGIYARHGVDAEVIIVHSSISPQALIGGEIDFDTSTTRDMSLALKGLPVRVVLALTHAPVHALIVRPDVRRPEDLKGKTLGIDAPKGLNERIIVTGLKKYGLTPGVDVNVLALGGGGSDVRVAALVAGRVDGTLLSAPHSTVATRKHGFKTLFAAREFSGLYSSSLATTMDKLRKDPDAIVRMLRGTIEGIRLLKNNKAEFMKILAQESRITDSLLAEDAYQDFVGTMSDTGIPSDNATMETIDFTKDLLGVTRDVQMSEVVDWSFARKALEGLKK